MILKKYGECLIGTNLILIVSDSRNKGDKELTDRISMYESRGYKVKVNYTEAKYESKHRGNRNNSKKSR